MKSLLHFIFPAFCLHCDEKIFKPPFCAYCVHHLSISSLSTTVFEKNPVTDLYLKYVKKYQFTSHIQTMAAFVVLKLEALYWPSFDIVLGENHFTNGIARHTAHLLNRKFHKKWNADCRGKKILQIKESYAEKDYSIFLLMI